ncbi:unnamed protein product [Ceratitis capitata]|uniref:(Mediterranean fruit fly) hypothetical protein n=1 Tax=Ceratitis capitata TaxID=7213 RepID=A0A811UR40_CERCA|nr:unnamed protein product [Ceratitis capitata]
MNSQHPQPLESKEEDKSASEDDDQDYSWVLEPVCGIVDMGGDDDDDSDSDSDSDDDTSSNSFQSSSDSSSTAASNSNSPTINPQSNNCNSQDEKENTRMTTAADVDNAMQTPPVHRNNVPVVYKPGRGRRYAAQNAQLSALTSGEHKCFQCSYCGASFQNAGGLSKHSEKTFTHIGSLNTHIRIHSGKKPCKYELCPKAFTQSSSLIYSSSLVLHLKSHDDAEIFNCPECDKSFKQEGLLEKHLQMHPQQLVHQCSICREAFRTSSEQLSMKKTAKTVDITKQYKSWTQLVEEEEEEECLVENPAPKGSAVSSPTTTP